MKVSALLLIVIVACSCTRNEHETIVLGFQKDLVPEGIAIDPQSKTVYLNSLHLSKIVKCNLDGSAPEEFIASHQFGYLPGFGMTIKDDVLYALGNTLPKKNSRSILLLLNKQTGELIRSYAPADTTFKYLNDLAVCDNNDVYITDSESNKVYIIDHVKDSLDIYLDTEEIGNSNGIAVSDNNKFLYLASNAKGIRVVDLSTKKIVNDPNREYAGIDGLKYYKNTLIAMRADGVYQYFLNDEGTAIVRSKRLLEFDKTFFPTTFALLGDAMYFNMNAQLENFHDQAGTIIDEKKLTSYTLMKIDLSSQ